MHSTDPRTPGKEIENRINALQAALAAAQIDGALILQNTDLFYFTGTLQQGQLYVPAEGPPLLLIRKSLERAIEESPLDHTAPISSPRQLPERLSEYGFPVPAVLGMELDVLPANLYLNFKRLFTDTRIVDISPTIRTIRSIKSEYEIDIIRKAAGLSDKLAQRLRESLHEGLTEIELAADVEAAARKLGHQGIVRMRLWGSELFYGHLMAGPSAAVPSYLASPTGGTGVSRAISQGASFRPIRRNEPLLFDFVFAYRGYLSDHTRIFSVGQLPDKLLKAHEAMLRIQSEIQATARPGTAAGDLYEKAVRIADQYGYGRNFMGTGSERIRFIGHGIGLELDEYPFLARGQKMRLARGMIVALEPKLIFPGEGVVGIENTHLVTDKGLEPLTRFEQQVMSV